MTREGVGTRFALSSSGAGYRIERRAPMRATISKAVFGLLFVLAAFRGRAATITPDPWPREFTTPKGNTAVMYQPQIETFKGDTFAARAAVSVTKKDEKAPKFGVIFFTARVSVDRDDRSVEILGVKVSRVRFPDITPEKEKAFAGIIEAEVPKWNLVISYDRALENVKVAEREKKSAKGIKNDAPKILFTQEPTVLVLLDGEPQLRDVEGAPLKLVVNTALFMVLDTRNNTYYLSGGKKWWYEASDAKGPWRSIGGPPSDIADFARQAAAAQKENEAETHVADSPTGPWLLADSIPTDDVDQIPPSAPVYNVKYVQIYDSTPDEVYVGYTPGYLGCYPWGGTVVWGTGWSYRPWI